MLSRRPATEVAVSDKNGCAVEFFAIHREIRVVVAQAAEEIGAIAVLADAGEKLSRNDEVCVHIFHGDRHGF